MSCFMSVNVPRVSNLEREWGDDVLVRSSRCGTRRDAQGQEGPQGDAGAGEGSAAAAVASCFGN